MVIDWWVWVGVGLVMFLAEILTPGGFYLFFVGLAALIVGAMASVVHSAWIQILLFVILMAVLIVFLRKPLLEKVQKTTLQSEKPEFVGETAVALDLIAVGKEGRVELRGTIWQARNGGQSDVMAHSSCIVTAREGLLFVIRSK